MSRHTPYRITDDDARTVPAVRPAGGTRFSVGSLAGSHSRVNQDSHACRAPDFFAVADGVGGGSLGEVASAMLVRQLSSLHAPQPEQIAQVLQAADQAIAQRIAQQGQGPGAAVCAAVWSLDATASNWLALTVGDCQVTVLARGDAGWEARWTSALQTYAAAGLQPPTGVPPDAPANMVGCGMALPAQFDVLRLAPGERILLCSDGFHQTMHGHAWPYEWRHSPSPLPEDTAGRWCQEAQLAGARDDVTVILVEPDMAESAQRRYRLREMLCLGLLGLCVLVLGLWRWQ